MYNPDQKLIGENAKRKMFFEIHPNMSIYLFIHDPKFFISTDHPLVFPGYFKKFEVIFWMYVYSLMILTKLQNTDSGMKEIYFISVTEHQLLNRLGRPCEVHRR